MFVFTPVYQLIIVNCPSARVMLHNRHLCFTTRLKISIFTACCFITLHSHQPTLSSCMCNTMTNSIPFFKSVDKCDKLYSIVLVFIHYNDDVKKGHELRRNKFVTISGRLFFSLRIWGSNPQEMFKSQRKFRHES